MQKASVFIATPCYGGTLTSRYVLSLLGIQGLLLQNGIGYDVFFHSDSLITRARNAIAGRFLRQETCSHLLFIDSDLSFDPAIVLRYLAFDKDLIAGIYPVKQMNIGAIRQSPIADDRLAEAVSFNYSSQVTVDRDHQPQDGFVRADFGATGFMMIKRQVLERMAAHYPELRYQDDCTGGGKGEAYAFFDTMIHEGRSLPEDYSFCKRWQDMGGEIWVDIASKFAHQGTYVYAGDVGAALAQSARPEL